MNNDNDNDNSALAALANLKVRVIAWWLFQRPRGVAKFLFSVTPADDPYLESQVYAYDGDAVTFIEWRKNDEVLEIPGIMFDHITQLASVEGDRLVNVSISPEGLSLPQLFTIFLNDLLSTRIEDLSIVAGTLHQGTSITPSNVIPFQKARCH